MNKRQRHTSRSGEKHRAASDRSELLIRELFRTPERYLRSVHLERDFDDLAALDHYIVTPPMAGAFNRIVEGLRHGSGRRAWRVTGDYGSGKSSFALALAHLLRDPAASSLARLRHVVDFRGLGVRQPRFVPVLVTGARESIVPAIARTVGRTIQQIDQKRGRGRAPRALVTLMARASEISRGGEDIGALLELLTSFTAYVAGAGQSGVLLVLDELGKFLEHAALHPEREDVYVLQRLAETAARSGDQPLIVLGLLHQGFQAYSERLPITARHEWEKVSGRFEEIVFDQPLAHTAALVAGALNVQTARVPRGVVRSSRGIKQAMLTTGWYNGASARADVPDPLSLFPLHPTMLPVLVRFFARFGQHERSLFSFLLSSEPFALQTFADRRAGADSWYRLADFYDYIRAAFGHRLAGASYRSQWLRIVGIIDGVTGVDALDLRLLKTVAVLNVLDAEHLLASESVLRAAVAGDEAGIIRALTTLKKRGVLFDRGAAGGYCLWPNTSVNLETAFEAAQRALGPLESVAGHIAQYLDTSPLLARRHYIETGTMRYFEPRYADVSSLKDAVLRATDADGVVVVALCDGSAEQMAAEGFTTTPEAVGRPDVLIAVPQPLIGLVADLQDARCWQCVMENTPELANDPYATSEVSRQVAASHQTVRTKLNSFIGLRGGQQISDVAWVRAGQPIEVQPGRLLAVLSDVCDELYSCAPRIRNELLNRRTLSSAAAAARMRLVERMFKAADQPQLGIAASKAPPEKSMYLSVLKAGAVHREESGRYLLGEPPSGCDPLHLRPALTHVLKTLEDADGHRVPVTKIVHTLQVRPFGVRSGVIPLLLAVVVTTRTHELAVYENGTFLQRFGPTDFLRLVKLPTAFEFQLCRVTGVRTEVFERLVEVFATERLGGRPAELLDVVTPLCVFAAQLPESTRRAHDLPAVAASVRNALLAAQEPGTLLFHDLPLACGVGAFSPDKRSEPKRVHGFVSTLRNALDELRAAYPQLLGRLAERVANALGGSSTSGDAPVLDRVHTAERATRVAMAAREPRLRAFAHRLADVGLAGDAWIEALGSFLISKPPARWAPGDEARSRDELDLLMATFRRVEGLAFAVGEASAATALRIALTAGDGGEAIRVVHTRPDDERAVEAAAARIAESLPESGELRIAALSRVLWSQLEATGACNTTAAPKEDAVRDPVEEPLRFGSGVRR